MLEKVYRQSPGIVIEGLPKLKSVAIRADKQTLAEIKELLRRLEEAAQRRSNNQQAPIRLDDATIAIELLRWLETRQHNN